METLIAFLIAILLGAFGAAFALGYLFRDRWGPAGRGPFALFGGAAQEERRGPPWGIVLAIAALFIWAGITLLAFAPAGLTLALILFEQETVLALILAALCLNGFALSTGMLVSSLTIMSRNARVRPITMAVAGWSAMHHVAIFGYFAVLAYNEGPLDALMFLGVPCGIGVLLSVVLAWAGRRAEPTTELQPAASAGEA